MVVENQYEAAFILEVSCGAMWSIWCQVGPSGASDVVVSLVTCDILCPRPVSEAEYVMASIDQSISDPMIQN